MDDTQTQLWTYLRWLQDCGQIFAAPAETLPLDDEDTEVFVSPMAKVYDLSFVSAEALSADERTMVQKIAAALGFSESDYVIVQEWDAAAQRVTVFLGEGSEGPDRLQIPHPRAMLRDPGLKRQAWDILQVIKRVQA